MRGLIGSGLILIGLAGSVTGCGNPTDTADNMYPALLEQSGEVTLAYGDEVAVAGSVVRVAFGQVLSDSRCPIDVVCVWEGNAEVEIGIRVGMGPTVPLRLNTSREPRFVDWQGIRITLLQLMPAAHSGTVLHPEDYSVHLRLEPLE
jgi:hypothetical protein